jgi:hypothetical protein
VTTELWRFKKLLLLFAETSFPTGFRLSGAYFSWALSDSAGERMIIMEFGGLGHATQTDRVCGTALEQYKWTVKCGLCSSRT